MPRKARAPQCADYASTPPDNPALSYLAARMSDGGPAVPDPSHAERQVDSNAPGELGAHEPTEKDAAPLVEPEAVPPPADLLVRVPSRDAEGDQGTAPVPGVVHVREETRSGGSSPIDVTPAHLVQQRRDRCRQRRDPEPPVHPIPHRRICQSIDGGFVVVDEHGRFVGVPCAPIQARHPPQMFAVRPDGVPGVPIQQGLQLPPGVPGDPGRIYHVVPGAPLHLQQGRPPMQPHPGIPAFPPHRAPGVPGGSLVRMPPMPITQGHPEARGARVVHPPELGTPVHVHHQLLPHGPPPPRHGQLQQLPPGLSAHPLGNPDTAMPQLSPKAPPKPQPVPVKTPPPTTSAQPAMVSPLADIIHQPSPVRDIEGAPALQDPPRKRRRENEEKDEVVAVEPVEVPPVRAPPPLERLSIAVPPVENLEQILPGYNLSAEAIEEVFSRVSAREVMDRCKETYAMYQFNAQQVVTSMHEETEDLKHAHKLKIDEMNARASEALTNKDNMIETLRKYNREFGHASKVQDGKIATLNTEVKTAKAEATAARCDAKTARTLVEALQNQLREASAKVRGLVYENNLIRSAQMRVDDLGAQRPPNLLAPDEAAPMQHIRMLQQHLGQRTAEKETYKTQLDEATARMSTLEEENRKLMERNAEAGDNSNYERLAASMGRLRHGMKKLAETHVTDAVEVTDVAPKNFLDPTSEVEAMKWLKVWETLKVAYERRGILVQHKNAMVNNFRDGYNEMLQLEREVHNASNKEEQLRKHVAFVHSFDTTKKTYVELAKGSNTAARLKKEAEKEMEDAIADVKRLRREAN